MTTNLARSATPIPSPFSNEADQVRYALIERGLETPLLPHQYERDEKYQRIKNSFTDIARTLGLDLSDDSLCETPHRIAKMYVDEIFSGLDYFNFPKITVIDKQDGCRRNGQSQRYQPDQYLRTSFRNYRRHRQGGIYTEG